MGTTLTAGELERFLKMLGFHRGVVGGEVVYIFHHTHYRPVVIKVWTSISAATGLIRSSGADAIRITVAYENEKSFQGKTSQGLYKGKRIYRTGDGAKVLDRLHERVREAYAFANQWIRTRWRVLPR